MLRKKFKKKFFREIKEDNEIISLIDHSHLPQSMALKNEELKYQIKKTSSYTAPPKKDVIFKIFQKKFYNKIF